MARITREDGTHRVALSPDRRFYVDAYSNRDTPAVALPPRHLGQAARDPVPEPDGRPRALRPREAGALHDPGGRRLRHPGERVEAAGFDPSKKYPVLIHVYGGPGAPIVQDRWDRDDLFDQLLVAQGYVVASFDPRSATGQSKTLEDLVVRRMMSDVELGDLRRRVKWLKAQPWVDPARFGIWGWSGGGSFTLLAMTRTQEFKAGISVAPVTDWRFYDSKFGEAYMKTAEDEPRGLRADTSFVKRAKDLSGRLLLVFGTYDDNVHPQNEWAFADALDRGGKALRHHGLPDAQARHRRHAARSPPGREDAGVLEAVPVGAGCNGIRAAGAAAPAATVERLRSSWERSARTRSRRPRIERVLASLSMTLGAASAYSYRSASIGSSRDAFTAG